MTWKDNRALIIDTIFHNRITSRVELSRLLNLSKPTVNEHVERLLRDTIVIELGKGRPKHKGGRRPTLIAPNGRYAYVLAIDICQSIPVAAVGDLLCEPIDREYFPPTAIVTADAALSEVIKLLERSCIAPSHVGAVIIAEPSVDAWGSTPGYSRDAYTDAFKAQFKTPITFRKGVDLMAVGELRYLRDEYKNTILFINCGKQLTASIAVNGTVFEGESDRAGNVGAMLLSNGEPAAKLLCREEPDAFDTESESIGRGLGAVVVNCSALTDVNTVVLGGDAGSRFDALIPFINNEINRSELGRDVEVIPASLGSVGGVIGCFELGALSIIGNIR